jgi:predicted PurR-regulated permease PerM
MITDSPIPASGMGWTRSRIIFLSVSAVALVALLVWTSEVLLPFILALTTAYVLTPAVALCERVKVPRALSIIIVYTTTLGSLYAGVAAIAPRLYAETENLARETPAMLR